MPNPAATNFPTSAKSVMPGVFSFFDLYMAKPVSWGSADPSNCGFKPTDNWFYFLRYHAWTPHQKQQQEESNPESSGIHKPKPGMYYSRHIPVCVQYFRTTITQAPACMVLLKQLCENLSFPCDIFALFNQTLINAFFSLKLIFFSKPPLSADLLSARGLHISLTGAPLGIHSLYSFPCRTTMISLIIFQ